MSTSSSPRFLPRKLNPQEEAKLHHEVSQIVNHRFILTTIAVTVFAISSGWIVPQLKDIRSIEDAKTTSALAIVLTFIMLMLYWQSHYLRTILRTFTSYLIVVGESRWETDWQSFRRYHDRDAHNDTKAQILAYVCFCIIAGLYPAIVTFSILGQVSLLQWVDVFWGLLVGLGIIAHTHRYEEHCEQRFIMEWENALIEADKSDMLSGIQIEELKKRRGGIDQ